MATDAQIAEMILQLNDDSPDVKDRLMRVLDGTTTHLVKCNSKTCKGRVIAEIKNINGKTVVEETPPLADPKGKYGLYKSGLEGSRMRFDGQRGFRCYCGNNSILAAEERGVMIDGNSKAPDRNDLDQIHENLQNSNKSYQEVNGRTDIDGFSIERV